ncbi:hypothetical protein RB213_007298 [Colletotrichum asianum]
MLPFVGEFGEQKLMWGSNSSEPSKNENWRQRQSSANASAINLTTADFYWVMEISTSPLIVI